MLALDLILYLLAAVCFVIAAFVPVSGTAARINFLALGLLFYVLVPLIATIDRL